MVREAFIVAALGVGLCTASPAATQTPGEAANPSRIQCSDQTYATVIGTIESLDLQDPTRWLIKVTQDQMGGCLVDFLTITSRPAPNCKIGRKITASGRVFLSNSLVVDSFSCR
jgi:hypothetical protein